MVMILLFTEIIDWLVKLLHFLLCSPSFVSVINFHSWALSVFAGYNNHSQADLSFFMYFSMLKRQRVYESHYIDVPHDGPLLKQMH